MPASAPRLSPRLVDAIERLDDRRVPIAEVARRVGREADRLGLPRPSYERIRLLVHEFRRIRAEPSTAGVVVDVAFRARPLDHLERHLTGVPIPRTP